MCNDLLARLLELARLVAIELCVQELPFAKNEGEVFSFHHHQVGQAYW